MEGSSKYVELFIMQFKLSCYKLKIGCYNCKIFHENLMAIKKPYTHKERWGQIFKKNKKATKQ